MISVIIPTLNEARNLPGLLKALRGETVAHEVLVVDAYSLDGTAAQARDLGVRVVMSNPGRGRQIDEGARHARGGILLFLHADSVFPQGGFAAVDHALAANPNAPGGNFRLLFDGDDGFSRWLEGFYAWIRARGVYYGDSGIFVRRDVYDRLGGIRPLALMEDYDFVRRLERAGETLCIGDPPLITSSRRFRGRRPVRIIIGWLWIHALFLLGVPPDRLARLYDSERRRGAAPQDRESLRPQSYS
ncbi:MAG: TIGR04283 family arsenosugar biosynthesis glycosyltransferase [Proteobacteria bacterium]|nr:TIGR04283 family arsenosugar biosynthesis glycosyltransferase [Pseudomonadota bacterium]